MSANQELIERFYAAFARLDGEAMEACYAPDVVFSDPAFGELKGAEPGAMWRMLTGGADDLKVELVASEADGETGSAKWVAHYTFTQTGRKVKNCVSASFRFAEGLIVEHRDEFDFHLWSRQALGLPGLLLGWTPLIQNKVRRTARGRLEEFMASEA